MLVEVGCILIEELWLYWNAFEIKPIECW